MHSYHRGQLKNLSIVEIIEICDAYNSLQEKLDPTKW